MGGAAQAIDIVRRGRARLNGGALNAACFAGFLVALAILFATQGLTLSRDSIFLLLLAGLLAISASDVNRWARGVIVDWLPFYGALLAYDLLRGFVGNNPLYEPHVLPQIRVDEWFFDDIVPTVELQARFFEAGGHPLVRPRGLGHLPDPLLRRLRHRGMCSGAARGRASSSSGRWS